MPTDYADLLGQTLEAITPNIRLATHTCKSITSAASPWMNRHAYIWWFASAAGCPFPASNLFTLAIRLATGHLALW